MAINMNTALTEIRLIFTNKGNYEVPAKFIGLEGICFASYSHDRSNNFYYTEGLKTLADFAAKYFSKDEVISELV